MTDQQTERADLARVYRAIGNSKAPTPARLGAWEWGELELGFRDGDTAAVDVWAVALDAAICRGQVLSANGRDFHEYYAKGSWQGWEVKVYTDVDGQHPIAAAVLGTGDEPADEAIVPNAGSAS